MQVIRLETVQWAKLKDIDDVERIGDQDYSVLEELKSVLIKHGYTDRFGVCLLHRHFDIEDDEIVVENTDVGARVSVLSVEKASGSDTSIETMWRFSNDLEAITRCVLRCHYDNGHKQRHHIEGH